MPLAVQLGRCLLLGIVAAHQIATPREREVTYGFATKEYVVRLRISFLDPYVGVPLVFYDTVEPTRRICPPIDGATPGACIDRFLGAVAIVKYSVKLANGGTPGVATIRECVTVTAQSPGLAERAPFSMTLTLVEGVGSDIQAFGYDDGRLKEADRARVRKQTKTTWRLYRQELYLNWEKKPFAIVEWLHTLDRISIDQIYSPPVTE
jgi:hypothetical protein